jgi:outer membrane protein assembly factor BamA
MTISSREHLKWVFLLYLWVNLGSPLQASEIKKARIEVTGPAPRKVAAQLVKSTTIPPLPPLQKTWERAFLLKAIQEEVPRWLKVLHGFGYYDAQIRTRLRQAAYNWVIELQISPGTCYNIRTLLLEEYTVQGITPVELPIDLEIPAPASAETIAQYEKEVLKYYQNSGYASAEITDKMIQINPISKTVKVKWILSRGHYYLFGPLDILGLNRLHPSVIHRKILFREGTPYNKGLIDQSQAHLENSGQFNEINLAPNWSQEKEGHLPLLLSINEAKRRSIAFQKTEKSVLDL